MATNEDIQVNIRGSAAGVVAAAAQAKTALHGVSQSAQGLSASTVATGVVMGNVMTQMATHVLKFAKEFLGQYAEIGKEVIKLQRVTGQSAEEMSKLRFAAEETGVPIASLTRGITILSSHLAANDKVAKQLGVAYKDAAGNVKPMTEIIGNVADKIMHMTDQVQKNALAKAAFGRSFQEMLPLLRLGGKGMEELGNEAKKMGLVLSEKNVGDIKKYVQAKREMHAAISGVAVQLGQVLLPKLTSFTTFMANGVIGIKNFLAQSGPLQTVIKGIAIALGVATAAWLIYLGVEKASVAWQAISTIALEAWTAAEILAIGVTEGLTGVVAALNLIFMENPIAWVIMAVVGLIAAFVWLMKSSDTARHILSMVFEGIGWAVGKLISLWIEGWRHMGDIVLNAAGLITKIASKAFGWIPGIGDKFKEANKAVTEFHKTFDQTLSKASDTAWTKGASIGKGIGDGIGNAIKNFKIPDLVPNMPNVDTGTGDGAGDLPGGGTTGMSKAMKKKIADTKKMVAEQKKQLLIAARDTVDAFKEALKDIKKVQDDLVKASKDNADATEKMWNATVDAAQSAMDAAVNAAQSAADKMADAAKSVGDSIRSAFDITSVFKDSFAEYLGGGAFLDMFRKRLTDAKAFVADIKALAARGLAPDLLLQLAQAGPTNGLKAAEMLLNDSGTIEELNKLQAELTSVSAEGGQFVAQNMYGAEVATTAAAATSATGVYNKAVADQTSANAAAQAAITAAEAARDAAIAAGQANIDTAQGTVDTITNMTINVSSPASADQIAKELAWAISTNAPTLTIGAKPPAAGTTSKSTATPVSTAAPTSYASGLLGASSGAK